MLEFHEAACAAKIADNFHRHAMGVYCYREDGLYCGDVCTELVPIGERCNLGVECVTGAFCDLIGGVCTAQHANGEACEAPDDCQSGYCNIDGSQTCAEIPPLSAADCSEFG